jgi:hydrophobic/amphiphilic exporter-1 (mainly G- bacteria), HAE1 family
MSHKKDFNYRITEFFLNNTRLTLMSLFLLIVAGVFTTLSLKTVGFPNPEIKISIVNTVYPGADAETILKEVTTPIESAVKDVKGIENYTSTSQDSFSSVVITLDTKANKSEVEANIKEAVDTVTLPETVEKPKIINPEISGPDIILSIYQPDLTKRFQDTETMTQFINDLPETDSVTQDNKFTQSAVLTLDQSKLAQYQLKQEDVERAITTANETIPVATGVEIDGSSQSIVTKLSNELDFNTIGDLPVFYTIQSPENLPPTPPTTGSVLLKDLGALTLEYSYEKPGESLIAIKDSQENNNVVEVVTLNIKTNENVDQTKYYEQIKEFINEEEQLDFTSNTLTNTNSTNNTLVINNYTTSAENEEQVSEVLSGLIGGPLDIENNTLAQVGWLLGGIQLVFLVMVAFVSWRAALIAAASIPLSLLFTNIYLYLIGENLNTLVLFSFVLVIGLVVDPALVILESIQRKLDTGLKGKAAALAAVRDVGLGLFLATLTNIIVFAPFGIISGILGQIFSNIPMTIVPAVIGSYIVPLVFLSWIGSKFMKSNKNTTTDEVENLWPIAKWLIGLNKSILYGNRFVRTLIIIVGLVVSVGSTLYLFNSGQVRSVQFASGDNPPNIVITSEFKSGLTDQTRSEGLNKVLETTLAIDGVNQVFLDDTFGIFINLDDERDATSSEIAKDINDKLGNLDNYFLDIKADILSNGPSDGGYQVVIAVEDQDLNTIQKASEEVGNTIDTICEEDGKFIINNCTDKGNIVDKVDDGFSGRTSKIISYNLDPATLNSNLLNSPQGPASIVVNQQLKNAFPINTTKDELTKIDVNGVQENLFIRSGNVDKDTRVEVDATQLINFQGQPVNLSSVLKSTEVTDSQSAIKRVKGKTVNTVQLRLTRDYNDQGTAAQVTQAIVDYYAADSHQKTKDLGLKAEAIESFDEGGSAGFVKSFQELLVALVLAIIISYFVLAIFFNSLSLPITILYTIPLTLIGVFPAIAFLSNGQFGLLEIIGLIILVGLVENVAIFLIDSANQYIQEGKDPKDAIATATGIRMRSVFLTSLTAIASLSPLAILSETYRPLSLVIIFGLLTSGLFSLVTTPILFIFFRWLSAKFQALIGLNKLLFFPLFVFYILYWALFDKELPDTKSTPTSPQLGYGGETIKTNQSTTKDFFSEKKQIEYDKLFKVTKDDDKK